MNKKNKLRLLELGIKQCPNLERIIEYAKRDELILNGMIYSEGMC